MGYRDEIYEQYGTRFQDAPAQFDVSSSERWGKAYDWYVRDWLPADRAAPILEVGCGTGRFLHYLAGHSYTDVQGIDISPEQVALAGQVTPRVEQANVLDYLAASSRQYSLIVALDLIEHLTKAEIQVFLRRANQRLFPGGRLVIQTPNGASLWGTQTRYGDFTHEVGLTPDSLSRLLRLHGFRAVEVREAGPVPWGYSVSSTIRCALWQLIRWRLMAYSLVEIGNPGERVLTRVFLASATAGAE